MQEWEMFSLAVSLIKVYEVIGFLNNRTLKDISVTLAIVI